MAESTSSERTLVLLRHGESEWNAKNLFTGWVDVDLSAKGEAEAANGGRLLAARGLRPDVVHTSVLRRAIRTANIALDAADLLWLPVKRYRAWVNSDPSRNTDKGTHIDIDAVVQLAREALAD